jgi:hypothetical protein
MNWRLRLSHLRVNSKHFLAIQSEDDKKQSIVNGLFPQLMRGTKAARIKFLGHPAISYPRSEEATLCQIALFGTKECTTKNDISILLSINRTRTGRVKQGG